MRMILYLDVFFLVNAIMDGLLLLLVKSFLKIPARGWRIVAAAVVGAAWACLVVVCGRFLPVFFWRLSLLFSWVFGAGGMVYLAFTPEKFKDFFRCLIVFWIVSVAAGGIFGAAWVSGRWSFAGVLCVGAGIYFGGCAAAGFLREQMRIRKNLYEVTIYYQGKQETVTALWDTGNQLYEPYGHQPVHVISQEAAGRLGDTVSRIIYIPFSAVGTEHGILPGIRADRMEVAKDGAVIKRLEKPWLAISREPLSATHQYEMLLHGEEQ